MSARSQHKANRPVAELSTGQLAWCAGVVDALALVRLRETNAGSALAYVGVSTALLPVAAQLADLTGTRVTTVRRNYDRAGCTSHCLEPHLHVDSTTARWSLTGARAVTFLQAVRPWLTVKAELVDMALAASAGAPSKPATTQKMADLGWPKSSSPALGR